MLFICQINEAALLDVVTDGVIIAGEPYFKRCCDLAEHIPNLFSPNFAIANLDPSSVRGLFVDNKVCALLPCVFKQGFANINKEMMQCRKYKQRSCNC